MKGVNFIDCQAMIKSSAKTLVEWEKNRYLRARIAQRQRRAADFEGAKQILCLQMNAIGDMVMTQPAWAALKASDPERRIDVLCRSHIAPLFRQDPNINDILAFNPRKYRPWLFEDGKKLSDLISCGRYDAIIDFTALPLTAGLCGNKNAPPSVGFSRFMRFGDEAIDIGQAYDLSFPYSEEKPLRHLMVSLVAPLTTTRGYAKRPALWIGKKVVEKAKALLSQAGIESSGFVIIHPGAKWPPKQWPVTHWSCLIHFIKKEMPSPVLILGGPGDESLVSAITKSANSTAVKTMISNEIDATAAIIKQASLCISNDSAPMHIAVAVGTKSIALFGPVSPSRSAPPLEEGCTVLYRPMFCSPCELYYSRYRCRRGLNFCMYALNPQEVFGEVTRIL
jgi:ADP-heptose:LPS heptosyltransferase